MRRRYCGGREIQLYNIRPSGWTSLEDFVQRLVGLGASVTYIGIVESKVM